MNHNLLVTPLWDEYQNSLHRRTEQPSSKGKGVLIEYLFANQREQVLSEAAHEIVLERTMVLAANAWRLTLDKLPTKQSVFEKDVIQQIESSDFKNRLSETVLQTSVLDTIGVLDGHVAWLKAHCHMYGEHQVRINERLVLIFHYALALYAYLKGVSEPLMQES